MLPFHIFMRPIVYLVAVILFWRVARKRLDWRWPITLIIVAVFMITAAIAVYEGIVVPDTDGVIDLAGLHIPYPVAKAVLENIGLFSILGSVLLLQRQKLKSARIEVRRLAQIAHSSADAIASIDSSGAITSWNLGAEMVFGQSAEEMRGQRISRIVAGADWDKLSRAIGCCLNEGFVRGLSCRMLAKGRREIVVELTLSAMVDDEGKTCGMSLFMRDITAQREDELELLHKARMEAAEALASGVVEEFGNLLTVISGKAHLGARGAVAGETRDAFAAIESCAFRAKSVTGNLMALARRQPPRKSMGQISRVLDTAVESLMVQINECGAALTRNYSQVPDTAFDSDQMLQVFTNLLTNALTALRTRGKHIDLAISSRHGFIEVSIRDDAPSITPDMVEEAFEPLTIAAHTKPHARTASLAFFVCREILKFHSGDISVDAGAESTTVHVYLPVKKIESPSLDTRPDEQTDLKHCKVAVIDSEPMIRDLLTQAIARKGHTVNVFADVEEAFAADLASGYDIVMIDVALRAPDGGRHVEKAKELISAAVVGIVGEVMSAEELEALRKGLAGCLHQPFGLEEINDLFGEIAAQTQPAHAGTRG